MKKYEVTVWGYFNEFFPAKDGIDAEEKMLRGLPKDFQVDEVDVIEAKEYTTNRSSKDEPKQLVLDALEETK